MMKRIQVVTSVLIFACATSFGQGNLAKQLVGKWTRTFNEREVSFVMTAEQKYEVEFAGDERVDVFGSYEISGKKITFNDEGGEYGSNETGVYEFKLEGNTISFTEVDDPVYGRRLLVEGEWTRTGEAGKE